MANRGRARPGHVVISKSFLGHFPLRIGTVPVLRYFSVVRKTPHGVETRQHSREAFGTPAFGGGFFLTHHWARTNTDAGSFRANQREATVSDAMALVCCARCAHMHSGLRSGCPQCGIKLIDDLSHPTASTSAPAKEQLRHEQFPRPTRR